jgi:hypothetical protein
MEALTLPVAVEGTSRLGYAAGMLLPPGAVLLTAYSGGAVAMQVRPGDPLFTCTLFPSYFAAVIWGGLRLRDRRVRGLSEYGNRGGAR